MHLHRMARAFQKFPPDSIAFLDGSLLPVGRQRPFALEQPGNQTRLRFRQRPYAALRLNQTDENQRLVLRMKHTQVQRHPGRVFPVNETFVEKGETHFVAGCGDDDIVFTRTAVGKIHGAALHPCDAGAGADFAVADFLQHFGVHRRVGAGGWEIRFGQAVVAVATDLDADADLMQNILHEARQPKHAGGKGVGRFAEEKLGHDVLRRPDADVRLCGDAAGFDGAIAAAVARADHQNSFIFKTPVVLKSVGMKVLAGKIILPGGVARHGMVAVGDEQIVEFFRSTVAEPKPPALRFDFFGLQNFRIETDVFFQIEFFSICLKISEHLPVSGIVGVIGGHGKIAVMRKPFAGNDVRRFAHTAVTFGSGIDPVTADPVVFFKTDEVGQAVFDQNFDGSQA